MKLAQPFMTNNKMQEYQQPLIMAVEDNEDNLLLVRYALEPLGFKLICVSESIAAVLLAKEYNPDLILLDILLPGLSGIDVLHGLKQEPITSNIPVVAVTALAGRDERERILEEGFDDYISKPFMIEDLEAMVRRNLCWKLNTQSRLDLC